VKKKNNYFFRLFAVVSVAIVSLPSSVFALEPEEQLFVSAYTDAVNSKNVEKLKKLVHPDSLACMTEKNKDYFDEIFRKDLRDILPNDTKFSFSKDVPELKTLRSEFGYYSIQPTYSLQVDYNLSKFHSVGIVMMLVKQQNKLFELLYCPTEKGLLAFRDAQVAKVKRETEASERITKISPELKADLLEKLKAGRKIDAIKLYQSKAGVELMDAKELVEALQKEVGK